MLARLGNLVPGRGGSIVLALLAFIATFPAAAQSDWAAMRATQTQLGLTQQMTQEALLIALGIDKAANADLLVQDRAAFDKILLALRDGSDEMKLAALSDGQLRGMLKQVDERWDAFAQEIAKGLEDGRFTRERIAAVVRLEAPLSMAVQQFALAYKNAAPKMQVHSLHLNTKAVAERQPLLARFMLKDFMLIAYGHDLKSTRMALTKSYSQLDRSFQALLYGDSEMQLIPAPTPAIEAQVEKAQELWRDFQPTIKTAAEGGALDKTQVKSVVAGYRLMLAAIEETVAMY